MKKFIGFFALLMSVSLALPSKATAQLCAGGSGIDTAIGCIPVFGRPEATIAFFVRWSLGIGGGLAFLLILYGGFQVMTSQAVPDKVKAGKELITAAITGLLFLIFSVVILEFIGVDILGLPL